MPSLVLELQADAADGSKPLPDILRKARMVATKLGLAETNAWIEHELHGYPTGDKVPQYRILYGDVRAQNPANGNIMPIRFGDGKFQDAVSKVKVQQSIGNLHDVVSRESEFLQVPFNEHEMVKLRPMFQEHVQEWIQPFRRFSHAEIRAIFDAVRNRILDWTLNLEREGILGEGMTFSAQEKERAASSMSINIGSVENFQGVIGSVTGSTLHIDNVAGVDSALKNLGFPVEDRVHIQQLIAQHNAAPPESKLAIARRGIQWVVENAEKLGTLAALFRSFFGSS